MSTGRPLVILAEEEGDKGDAAILIDLPDGSVVLVCTWPRFEQPEAHLFPSEHRAQAWAEFRAYQRDLLSEDSES